MEKRDMRESNPRFLLDRQARFHYANTPKEDLLFAR